MFYREANRSARAIFPCAAHVCAILASGIVATALVATGLLAPRAAIAQSNSTLPPIVVSTEQQRAPDAPVPAAFGPPREAPKTASEMDVTGGEVNAVAVTRPGEALEAVPGLIVTQHSGEGKANQYFLRGFNLDHGTDFAITVDGMPANMRTHGHGQGYADINFLIPELIGAMRVRKGPYFADEGDFSSAGAAHIDYINRVDKTFAELTVGSFGYRRGLAVGSLPAWSGNILAALEVTGYNGPWDVPDDVRKINGVLRYSEGSRDDGLSVTGMVYRNKWTSTDQVAQRAIDEGIIGRFGSLDPTDGGSAERYSLSARWAKTHEAGITRVEAYGIRSRLRLFNNFTYFLDDPVNGDQFSQSDRRTLAGLNASHTFDHRLGDLPSETVIGLQSRYDDIHVGLTKTAARQYLSTVRDDHVREGSVALYAQNTLRWTSWLRTVTGVRHDWFAADVASDTPANSGKVQSGMTSPKFGLVIGPFKATELFFNAGTGLHSNDARGSTITVDPVTKIDPLPRSPLLVRSKGAEIGARTTIVPGLESAVAFFVLDFDSELLFVGDAGTTEASRPSRRVGVEWTNRYGVNSWLAFDADVTFTRARFTDADPAGNFIPGAPNAVASLAVVFGEPLGWFGSIKLRYFGPRPLVEDGSVRSKASALVNARLGYRFEGGAQLQLDVLNLFNAKTNQIEYFYESRLFAEATAVADRHVHPVEPLAVRASLRLPFN
ncbi:TonB-denpendent receptor [Afipia sp. P52-10]|uniref:TonB-dependent receptor n=1 Tax=Afipia sp. P52-10 TaxID=1429916 RepID=UPI0003DF41A3|nr:TonB-denpendent receptor [Afipia sp. P52-10]